MYTLKHAGSGFGQYEDDQHKCLQLADVLVQFLSVTSYKC